MFADFKHQRLHWCLKTSKDESFVHSAGAAAFVIEI